MARLSSHLRLRTLGAASLAGVALVLAATVPSAGVAPEHLLVGTGSLSEPGGLVEIEGQLWTADGELGVCRVDTATDTLIEDEFCQPEPAVHPEPEPPATRPPAPVGLSYDAEPTRSNFYAGDASSDATGVWRLHLDPATGQIDSAVQIPGTALDRISALTIADGDADGLPEVYFAVKRSSTIYRVVSPDGLPTLSNPSGEPAVSVFGFAGEGETPALAAHGSTLYLAESGGVTQLDLTSTVASSAVPIPGLPAPFPGGAPSALAVDDARDRLYAGTMNDNGVDQIDVLHLPTGDVETYDTGFAAVSALWARPADGTLFVGDDVNVAGGAEASGGGRVWALPSKDLNAAHTTIDVAPPNFTNDPSLAFEFSSPTATGFECRLEPDAWAPCGGPTQGSWQRTVVDDGTYVFEVRALSGPVTRRTVVVDRVAPEVAIDNPESDRRIQSRRLTMRFHANEPGVSYTCVLDAEAPVPCDSPFWLSDLTLGDHVFSVAATDFAGNAGTAAEFAFTVSDPPPAPPPPSSPGGDDDSGDNSGPGGGGSSGSGVGTPRTAPAPAELGTVVLRPRVATLSRTRLRQRQLRSRPLGIAFNAAGPARYARITIQPWGRSTPILSQRRRRRTSPRPRILMRLTAPVEGGRRNYIRWRLTRNQARRLKVGRYRVTVALGETRRSFGPQKVLTMRVIGRG